MSLISRHLFAHELRGFHTGLVSFNTAGRQCCKVLATKCRHRQLTRIEEVWEERGEHSIVEFCVVAGGGWAPLHLVRKGYEATIPQLNQKPFVNDNLEWMKRNGYAL